MNDYQKALEAAGAKVHAFEQFGSYQGDWWARVTLNDGRTGWIHGYYGSCSGCDAFEAEFGWHDEECDEHSYQSGSEVDACLACQGRKRDHAVKLAKFGADYLDDLLTQEAAEAKAATDRDWDLDATKMLDFVRRESERTR